MPPSSRPCRVNVRMHSGSNAKYMLSTVPGICTPGTTRCAISARVEISSYCAGRTSTSELVDNESKSCLVAKVGLSLTGPHIYRHSYLKALHHNRAEIS